MATVIHLHPAAPAKPREGEACNGCGVCCTVEPCPAGALVSRRTQGACAALVWNEEGALYRCGLIEQPARYLPRGLCWFAPAFVAWARRSISAGRGCDCSYAVSP